MQQHPNKHTYPLLLVLLFLPLSASGEELIVRHVAKESSKDLRNGYFIELMELALSKTQSEFGTFRLEPSDRYMQQSRVIADVISQRSLDIVWTMTSIEREKHLHPIRIPLLKGLLGYRIFIIRKEDQDKFNKVSNKADLSKLIAGSGHDWPDRVILESNGLTVETSATYDGLFKMLALQRFDFLPRGANEVWSELDTLKNSQLTFEKKLLLYYPAAIYFFTSKKNKALADRIEKGLERSIADGSFERHFNDHPDIKRTIKQANLNNRIRITLKNPLLPKETPLNNAQLWYK